MSWPVLAACAVCAATLVWCSVLLLVARGVRWGARWEVTVVRASYFGERFWSTEETVTETLRFWRYSSALAAYSGLRVNMPFAAVALGRRVRRVSG